MIRVLLVDDSEVSLMILRNILEKEPDMEIIGYAHNGDEAISITSKMKPDIISMDINMPGLDGFSTTRKIMESNPVPIIIVSGIDDLESIQASFRAIEVGALAVLRKPPGIQDSGYKLSSSEFVSAIRTYSEVRVVQRRYFAQKNQISDDKCRNIASDKSCLNDIIYACRNVNLIVIGASTGGPHTIQQILSGLSHNYPIPLIIVQHMSPGFIEGFSNWIRDTTGTNTRIPDNNEILQPGLVYIAPDGKHTGVSVDLRIELSDSPPELNLRPSVSYLFRSAAKNYGNNTLGILLSGMGSDGARELLQIKQKGGCTIIQDKESSFIYGMPGSAEKINAGMFSLSPHDIIRVLNGLMEMKEEMKNSNDQR